MADIILHPEYEKVCGEIIELKTQLSALLSERDELLYHICKNIEADYMIKIGTLEYKAYKYFCMTLRIKRKIELIQAKLNRQEIVALPLIEQQLDKEYAEYEQSLKDRMDTINAAVQRMAGTLLTDEEDELLKKLYRQIVKKLHPDLNPKITEEELTLFHNAVIAYENGDLTIIKSIAMMVEEITPGGNDFGLNDGLSELRATKEKFLESQKGILVQIEKIKSSFPYNQKDFLQDEVAVKIYRNDLQVEIEEERKAFEQYELKLKSMLGGGS